MLNGKMGCMPTIYSILIFYRKIGKIKDALACIFKIIFN